MRVIFLNCLGVLVFGLSCTSDQQDRVDCEESGPEIFVENVINSDCQPSGSIAVGATGGTGMITYSIDGITFQESPVFTHLSSRTYTVIAKDEKECESSVVAEVGAEENALSVSLSATITSCGASEGTIEIVAEGGRGAYSYRLNSGAFGSENMIENLSHGNYTVTVRDSAGCVVSDQIRVGTDVSLESDILPIITENCAVALCHSSPPGDDVPFALTKSTVLEKPITIEAVIQRNSSVPMPPEDSDYSLSDEQIALISCWVQDGAIDN